MVSREESFCSPDIGSGYSGAIALSSELLLSGKTQKDKIILLEALYNRTSGVHFQKASPP